MHLSTAPPSPESCGREARRFFQWWDQWMSSGRMQGHLHGPGRERRRERGREYQLQSVALKQVHWLLTRVPGILHVVYETFIFCCILMQTRLFFMWELTGGFKQLSSRKGCVSLHLGRWVFSRLYSSSESPTACKRFKKEADATEKGRRVIWALVQITLGKWQWEDRWVRRMGSE